MRRFVVRFGMIVGVAGLGACGDPSAGTGTGQVSKERFPTDFASAYCANVGPCCRADATPFDETTCRTNMESLLAGRFGKLSPHVVYDAAAAGRCIDAYVNVLRGCHKATNDAIDTECGAVLTGTLPPGAACTGDDECARPGGAFVSCRAPTAGGGTVCALEELTSGPHGKLGDTCDGTCSVTSTSSSCSTIPRAGDPPAVSVHCFRNDGLSCSAEGTCVATAAVGESCADTDCVEGAVCSAGVCKIPTESGPCTSFDGCAAPSFCDFATHECTPKRKDGETCSSSDECAGDSCVFPDPGSSGGPPASGTCATRPFTNAKLCAGTSLD